MGLFSKKLTPVQEKEIQEVSDTLHSICIPCVQAWTKFMQDMYELMVICQPARMNESDPIGVTKLIKPALKSSAAYRDLLENAQLEFAAIETQDWFPQNLKKEIKTWGLFFRGQVSPLSMVIESLSPPDALRMRAREGGAKLNMFVSGMNMIAVARHLDVVAENLAVE